MHIEANSVEEYLKKVPEDKRVYFKKLREAIVASLPKGFEECLSYGMIGYVVPHSIYPAGYHCDPSLPLPFLNIGCQKNYIGFYHFCISAENSLLSWFKAEYLKYSKYKLDMGKSCVRFKRMDDIPYKLIGELMKKVSVKQWIEIYESCRPKK